MKIKVYCEEGGKKRAKCDGKCIENGVVCVHLVIKAEEAEGEDG